MVVIIAEVALLGKSFFHPCEVALAVRVEFRVDAFQIGEQTISGDFFACVTASKSPDDAVAVAQRVGDVFLKRNTRLDEGFAEFEFGDVHIFIFFDFGLGCKDYFSRSVASCLRSLPK